MTMEKMQLKKRTLALILAGCMTTSAAASVGGMVLYSKFGSSGSSGSTGAFFDGDIISNAVDSDNQVFHRKILLKDRVSMLG